ncbi:TPA: Dot/Icm T4SS effector CegC1 [Legionella pneumophila]|uniref:Dot/Icm T4SS effector CegC1 n=1 Tax=Legionella pneumophila TaxID=446 RepID=UPI000D7BA799|nr:Dot/Icm T4SS effector CegC1 [Legionella pneumophila]PYB44229.1 type IV secretion protein Dot [Legionella pneumophila]PYB51429.1 type IV secretion protein Dot [Legionella pneumophila]PYB62790.1 type IV secretion protein Dot [Legionella pneumophila]TID59635.1 type IV secretion protein Dot [Legionella pneumophila]TID60135.1 type IV secretion protein Dot [Legionella pneumophila]
MNTTEHTELGNGLLMDKIEGNPYLRIDEFGVLHLRLQRFGENNLPEPMELEMSAGEIIAMAGDYFTQANWTMDLDLPKCELFNSPAELGKHLIRKPIDPKEENALITAYNNLAAPDVTRKEIDRIYSINNANYVPFSPTLNFYAQQLMYYFRVKDYGEMLVRNQTHFTPWSIRVYILGHAIALRYAHLSYELKQLATDRNYQSDNPDLSTLKTSLQNKNETLSSNTLLDLANRYHAQAYSIELFTFHYYSDHFATGHMSMIGDLRVVLKERFGVWGNILANNLHDEVNRVGVYTVRPYDPTPNTTEAPSRARGDGKFDTCLNQFNRLACLNGMTASLKDINQVLSGSVIPEQKDFGGLVHMPDVDFNSRQHQPLLVLSKGKVYYRNNLSQIHIISPSEYEALRENPEKHGYKELTSKWAAFKLVTKLRLFPYLYDGSVMPVSDEKLAEIIADEKRRNPQRAPIPTPSCLPESEPTVFDWRTKASWRNNKDSLDILDGLKKHSILGAKQTHSAIQEEEEVQLNLGV